VERGKRDAERLGLGNVEFVRLDAREAVIPETAELVVVDPPRAGLSKGVRSAVAVSGASRLLYVSCDAATWARDVVELEGLGFALTRFVPFDFYPQTHHVELLSELTRT
jgi:tRNA/tmRNA/rRNA uracil-C5-methylase (TrmA/RlmC/RlmD family)